jgi:hypothetical protein
MPQTDPIRSIPRGAEDRTISGGARGSSVSPSRAALPAGLPGWLLYALLGLVVAAVAIAYLLGSIHETALAMILASAFVVFLSGMALKSFFTEGGAAARASAVPYALLMLFAGLYPAKLAFMPGKPTAEGLLTGLHQSLSLPSGGSYHLLVSAPIRGSGEGQVSYRLRVGDQSLDGRLERVFVYRRAGRRGSVRVPEDHSVASHEVQLGGGVPPRIEVERLQGVETDSRKSSRGSISMAGAAAACFGALIESANPDPESSLGAVVVSALLAAGGGALVGSALGWIGRKVLQRPAEAGPTRAKA